VNKVKKNMKKQIYKLGDTFISIIGTQAIKAKDTGKVIDDLRRVSNKVSLQAIDANIVYGIEYLIEVLKITLESERRKIMIANRPETDLLLRLSYTNQISLALKYAGLKNNSCGCFVIFSKDKSQLLKLRNSIESLFEVNNVVLRPSKTKREMISYRIGLISNVIFNDSTFTRYLFERASLITR
jgi:tRNA threonylcarbamoyladenosine modification (KEOPS) complex Cgi121 subunit